MWLLLTLRVSHFAVITMKSTNGLRLQCPKSKRFLWSPRDILPHKSPLVALREVALVASEVDVEAEKEAPMERKSGWISQVSVE